MDLARSYFKFFEYVGRLYCFSTAGVDIYRLADLVLVATVSKAITSGAVNDIGVWLGTAADGVYMVPHGYAGDITWRASKRISTTSATTLPSDDINDIDASGQAMLVAHSAGVSYLPSISTVYSISITGGASVCALGATKISYATQSALYTMDTPTAAWAEDDADRIGNLVEDFTGTDGAGPAAAMWSKVNESVGSISIQSNALRVTCNSGSAATVAARSTWSLPGNFSVMVKIFNITDADATAYWILAGIKLVRATDNGTVSQVYALNNLGVDYWVGRHYPGGTGSETSASRSGLSGFLKFERSGNVITSFYKVSAGDDWTQLHQTTHSELEGVGLKVDLIAYSGASEPAFGADFDDLEVVEGEVEGVISVVNVASCLRYGSGNYIFVGHGDGIAIFNGVTFSAGIDSTELGSVVEVADLAPSPAASATAGVLAYGTSDGADGGRFGVYDLDAETNIDTVSGDCLGTWLNEDCSLAAHGDILEIYAWAQELSPAPGATGVRRDWTLYAEIIDTLDGIAAGTVVLKINGTTVTPTLTAITNGYRVEYIPAGASGYSARITVELSAEDADGNTISRTWSFTTAAPAAATVTDSAPPNVVCIRDIGLADSEADEAKDGVNVIWLEDITSPLIVDEIQAEVVGKVAIDEATFHAWKLSAKFLPKDAAGLATRELQKGNIVAVTFPALGLTAQPCEVLGKTRSVKRGLIKYSLDLAYYEAV